MNYTRRRAAPDQTLRESQRRSNEMFGPNWRAASRSKCGCDASSFGGARPRKETLRFDLRICGLFLADLLACCVGQICLKIFPRSPTGAIELSTHVVTSVAGLDQCQSGFVFARIARDTKPFRSLERFAHFTKSSAWK